MSTVHSVVNVFIIVQLMRLILKKERGILIVQSILTGFIKNMSQGMHVENVK